MSASLSPDFILFVIVCVKFMLRDTEDIANQTEFFLIESLYILILTKGILDPFNDWH